MVPESHSLRSLFHQLVEQCYSEHVGIRDVEVSSYVADLLTDFCESDRLYSLRDSEGRPIEEIAEMMTAADPVHGTAASFDQERHIRKHIGDYTLFLTGMYPESLLPVAAKSAFPADGPGGKGKLLDRLPIQRLRIRPGSAFVRKACGILRGLRLWADQSPRRNGEANGPTSGDADSAHVVLHG